MNSGNLARRIEELTELRQKGLISTQEYEQLVVMAAASADLHSSETAPETESGYRESEKSVVEDDAEKPPVLSAGVRAAVTAVAIVVVAAATTVGLFLPFEHKTTGASSQKIACSAPILEMFRSTVATPGYEVPLPGDLSARAARNRILGPSISNSCQKPSQGRAVTGVVAVGASGVVLLVVTGGFRNRMKRAVAVFKDWP